LRSALPSIALRTSLSMLIALASLSTSDHTIVGVCCAVRRSSATAGRDDTRHSELTEPRRTFVRIRLNEPVSTRLLPREKESEAYSLPVLGSWCSMLGELVLLLLGAPLPPWLLS